MKHKDKVIVRFAPSPTGFLHVGSARTALFNYLYAKQNNGQFILRIEDTDKERSTGEFEKNILDGLGWLGISFDEKFRQSDRKEIYKKYLKRMIENGSAYISQESKGERTEIIRFKNPNEKIKFKDLIRGEIEFDTTELGDFVIAKDLETPLYHLAVVVDDFEMNITHIIRGEDGISNTPRQILIQRAIKAPEPQYAHIPLILASDRSKLSKRHGAVSVTDFRKKGYFPETMVNFLAMIGWNPGDDREIFNINELVKEFKMEKVQKGGAVFNIDKLNWLNGEYLKKLDVQLIKTEIKKYLLNLDEETLDKLYPTILERINKWSDLGQLIKEGELDWILSEPDYEKKKLLWKPQKPEGSSKDFEALKIIIDNIIKLLQKIESGDFGVEKIKKTIWKYAEEQGRGNVLWPMRYALSGKDKSPDPLNLAFILGKNKTLSRLEKALEKLNA